SGSIFSTTWDTTRVTNATHTLTAIATDSLGQPNTSSGVTVTAQNTIANPVVSITAPTAGNISGVVTITANATSQAGIASVQFKLDGTSNLGSPVTGTGPTFSYQWDTT